MQSWELKLQAPYTVSGLCDLTSNPGLEAINSFGFVQASPKDEELRQAPTTFSWQPVGSQLLLTACQLRYTAAWVRTGGFLVVVTQTVVVWVFGRVPSLCPEPGQMRGAGAANSRHSLSPPFNACYFTLWTPLFYCLPNPYYFIFQLVLGRV